MKTVFPLRPCLSENLWEAQGDLDSNFKCNARVVEVEPV